VRLDAGEIIGRDFRILRTLGEGGMGEVYVALQISTGKERALKTMRPQLVADAALRERFAQEARVGARIDSDHVVDVVGAGIDDEKKIPWIAMELLKGETLAELVARKVVLDGYRANHLLSQLGAALAAAHAAGVVHRDLKPENLFLARTRRSDVPFVLKVLDFGIAKLLAEGTGAATASVGTPLWMAPEQTETGAAVSASTDVWSFGLIAFHVFTGALYWSGGDSASAAALLRQIVLDPLPSASQRAKNLPEGFDAWFAKCVARAPADRFADGAAAQAALAPILATLPRDPVPSDPAVAATQPFDPALTPTEAAGSTKRLEPPPAPPSATPPASAAPASAPPQSSTRAIAIAAAVVVALGGVGAAVILRGASTGSQQRTQPQISPGGAASSEVMPTPSATYSGSKQSLPHAGALFASTPVELRWTSPGDVATKEVEVEVSPLRQPQAPHLGGGATEREARRAPRIGEPMSGTFPREIGYAHWPWLAGDPPAPGKYRWRVRDASADAWSEWREFAFYPSLYDRILDDNVLRVGMEVTYHAPFAYFDSSRNEVIGFDVDLSRMIADDLGVRIERVPREWSVLFTDLEARSVDVVMSNVSVTKERRKKFAFSEPYHRSGMVMTVRGTTHIAPPGTDKTIAVQAKTTSVDVARRIFPRATIRETDTVDGAFGALTSGSVDGVLSDEVPARRHAGVDAGTLRVDGAKLDDEPIAIMMPRGDERLRKRIDEALHRLEKDGSLGALRKKYGL
jgi:serine/threonine protein kinase